MQILGIVLTMLGLALIVQPLTNGLFGNPVVFRFFGIVPDGTPALIMWSVILVVGLVLVSTTKSVKTNAGKNQD